MSLVRHIQFPASVFQERQDDKPHHGNGNDRLVRIVAVKSRANGAPLRGFGT